MATRYLYGAAVQGIQNFIFQSNKLREIVGASELVEEVCTDVFEDAIKKKCDENNPNAILNASGHIKYIFDDKAKCEDLVRKFPKIVQQYAPGITFSQAVVEMTGDFAEDNKAVAELERRLKIQRNKPMRNQTLGLMGIQRSRQTGLPAVYTEKKKNTKDEIEYFDDLAYRKIYQFNSEGEKIGKRQYKTICEKAFPSSVDYQKVMIDLEENNGNNDWIAVIHIDGNNLGDEVDLVWEKGGASEFKAFSNKLSNAVQQSAIDAYNNVKDKFFDERDFVPIRPLILSGEDYNLICRADFALEYVEQFLKSFEEKTSFSACAGIAFVKSSFPFYYAYNLANELCDFAKEKSERKASCLMFHKVQDSFTESYVEIIERDLIKGEGQYSMQFGPYYIDNAPEGFWTIQTLLEKADNLDSKEGNAVKAHLRQWIDLLNEPNEIAVQKLKRLELITSMKQLVEDITTSTPRKKYDTYPTYDVLTIHTIKTQETK